MRFEIICQLIEHHNQEGLSKLILSDNLKTLDIFDPSGMHTPLSLLASQGKSDAVNWLIAFCEDLDDVNITSGQAVLGYAMGGYDEKVKPFFDSAKEARSAVYTGYNPFMPFFIHGCAMGGRVDKVKQLLSENKYKGLKDAAINGYRIVGNLEQVNTLNHTVTAFYVPWGVKCSMFFSGALDKVEHHRTPRSAPS